MCASGRPRFFIALVDAAGGAPNALFLVLLLLETVVARSVQNLHTTCVGPRLLASLLRLDPAKPTTTTKERLPLVSVAAVDGAAIGGGAELATSCDFRVAGPEASVRFVQVKVCRSKVEKYLIRARF